jgi:TnpA family transposase
MQVICTLEQGRIADRGAEAQQFRASGLNLVIASIVFYCRCRGPPAWDKRAGAR